MVFFWGLVPAQVSGRDIIQPLRWGFDDIGIRGLDCWNGQCLMTHPKAEKLLKEFAFDLWVTWYPDNACKWDTKEGNHRPSDKWSKYSNEEFIRLIDSWCEQHDIDWVLNQLAPIWDNAPEHCVDAGGHDWFNRPDGRHYFQFPDDILAELGRCKRLLGLMHDEAEHHQNNANCVKGLDKASMYDPKGYDLIDAADGHTAAVSSVAKHHAQYGLKLYTEHVFPVMFHDFARAGFVAGTKVLKEAWSPVYISCAMGAAIQYDTELWITPDLWGVSGYPGHSPKEYKSALLLAYHMGADCIYTESLALDQGHKGVGSLVLMTPGDYTVTKYGKVAKWFIHDYVPKHPRRYTFRRLRPRVAIIRQEDGCWGQGNAPYPWVPDRLFGSKEWESNEITEAWFKIWHLLTRGTVPIDGLSWWCASYKDRPYQVFCPLEGVVVFDHKVGFKHLEGVEVIFLTGLGVSAETLKAVERCVIGGATCVGFPGLLPKRITDRTGPRGMLLEGAGRWVVTEDFLSDHVRQYIQHVIPKQDIIRYQFGNDLVTIKPVDGDMNRIAVSVETASNSATKMAR